MLKHIPAILTPDLLKVLMEMGHGDEIVVPEVLRAVLHFLPLDSYTPKPVGLMEVVPGDPVVPAIWETYRSILSEEEPEHSEIEYIERFAFYERAKNAYAVIATGETAIYASILLKKGVVLPEDAS